MFENRRWVIVNKSKLDDVDFSKVLQESKSTCRLTVDGTKALLKYEGSQPSELAGETEYTHSQILDILNNTSKDDWNETEE
tara:strand:+ start:440 stop:682 length:243 start_codon:yes stop_codon:yes gene_type:complete